MDAPSLALARLSVAGCAPFPALVFEEKAVPLAGLNLPAAAGLAGIDAMLALLMHWSHDQPVLARIVKDPLAGAPLSRFTVHAPIQPRQVFCTIGNYASQLVEAALDGDDGPRGAGAATRHREMLDAIERRRIEGEPYACSRPASSVTGPFDPLVLPEGARTLDWEVEVGVVIGRSAWQVSVDEAMDHVAGYCTVNDITLRERVFRTDPKAMGTDFLQAKGGPGWLPVGPWLVPARQVADPSALRLKLHLNGEPMQDGEASDMVFTIAQQIAYLSRHTRLEPGDLICTGSPAGFGSHHGRYLRAGDVIEASVDALGTQRTLVVQK